MQDDKKKAMPIIIDKNQHVLTIQLNNPPYNPIGVAQVEALTELIATIDQDPSIRAVVIRGAEGNNFSVGANLKEGHLAVEHGVKEFLSIRLSLFAAIEKLNTPVIAAIQGNCLGGGLELALACHFRIADKDAKLGLPEIALGAAPMWGGAQRLLRTVGKTAALQMLVEGTPITTSYAQQIGLVSTVIEKDFDSTVKAFADNLSAKPPLAIAAILNVLRAGQDMPLDEALQYELEQFSQLAGTKDNIEGVTAFFEKRAPQFIGE